MIKPLGYLSFMKCQRETVGSFSARIKERLRLSAARRIEAGIHPENLAQDLDIKLRAIYRWLETHHQGGDGEARADGAAAAEHWAST